MRLAFSTVMATRKGGPSATRRCRTRTLRAVERLEAGVPGEAPAVVAAAADFLKSGCGLCGKCPGVTAPAPPRQPNRKECRRETLQTMLSIGWGAPAEGDLGRDDITRAWLAQRCSTCKRCPGMLAVWRRWSRKAG